MDFHSLSRRELQTLCKKNKIPANIANVAMADALKALEIVEGIEEFLNPSESETANSSIESPEKSEVTSPCVHRTGGKTTRRKTIKDEVENSQALTRTRRSTRKLVVGKVDEKPIRMVETPAATNTKRAQVTSVRRKMDTQLKEVEEDKKIADKDISETPGMLPGSRRRGLMGESTVRRTYGTRRSTRLAEKNIGNTNFKENEKPDTVTSELFPEESGENLEILEMNVKESSEDLGEIIQTTDVVLKEQLEEGLGRDNDKEVNSAKESDCLTQNQIQFENNFDKENSESFVVVGSEMKIEDDAVEGDECDVKYKAADDLKAEVYSEICEETDPSDIFDKTLEVGDEVEEKSGGVGLYLTKTGDVPGNGDKIDANEEMVAENAATETVEKEVIAQNGAFTADNKTLKTSEETMDTMEHADSGSFDNLSVTDEVLEYYAEKENDTGFKDGSPDDLEVNKYSEDLAAWDISDGGLEKESGKSVAEESLPTTEEKGVDLVSALESMTLENNNALAEELIDNNLMEKTIAMELNASADILPGFQPKERANNFDLVVDSEKPPTECPSDGPVSDNALPVPTADPSKVLSSSAETEVSHTVLPNCLTPLKKSASKTPVKKSASKKTPTTTKILSHVFDDKENIDNSGTKLILAKEKKNKDFGQSQYVDASLRKLKKELRDKLEISKNLKKNEQVMSSRPALQVVSENIVGE